jgi:hypothetical protein
MLRFFVGLVLVATIVSPASAVEYSAHSRLLEVTAEVTEPITDTRTTSAVGSWSEFVFANAFVGGAGTAMAIGSQNSDISLASIGFSGTLAASATSSFPPTSGGSAAAISELYAAFTVATTTRYVSTFDVTGDTATFFDFRPAGGGSTFHTNTSGVLTPGNYQLTLIATLSSDRGPSLEGTYAGYVYFVPEPLTLTLFALALPFFAHIRTSAANAARGMKRGLPSRSN